MLKGKLKPHIGVKSIILIVVCGLLVAVDLLTKHYEELFNWNVKIIPGFVEVSNNIHNQGCAFSFLNDNPQIGQPLLISLTSVMLVFLIGVFVFLPERFTLMKVTVAIVIAGAIGNFVDRCYTVALYGTENAYVRDFIGLNMLFSFVYCNVADFCITIGAVLAVLDLLFLGEWAVFPLTKSAKEAQAKKKEEELAKQNAQSVPDELPESESLTTDNNADESGGSNEN